MLGQLSHGPITIIKPSLRFVLRNDILSGALWAGNPMLKVIRTLVRLRSHSLDPSLLLLPNALSRIPLVVVMDLHGHFTILNFFISVLTGEAWRLRPSLTRTDTARSWRTKVHHDSLWALFLHLVTTSLVASTIW